MNTICNTEVEWQVRRIPLDAITVDPAVQQRAAGTSRDVVDEYVEAMRSGVEFPPIDVFSDDDGTFHLADGFHRLKAHRLAFPDVEEIECRVHPGNRDDAILFACGANAQHGLQRSRSDKLKAVTTLIHSERWSGWSDREIARQPVLDPRVPSGNHAAIRTGRHHVQSGECRLLCETTRRCLPVGANRCLRWFTGSVCVGVRGIWLTPWATLDRLWLATDPPRRPQLSGQRHDRQSRAG